MHAVVSQESWGDLLRNVMCQLLIDSSAKRWLGESAPPAQATPKQTIKTMGRLFKCGVKKHPLAMAPRGILGPPLRRTAAAPGSGPCCCRAVSSGAGGTFCYWGKWSPGGAAGESFPGRMGFHGKRY